MGRYEGFKIICTNCGNDEQNFIESRVGNDGTSHLVCRVCDHKAADKKYDWLKEK